MAKKKDGDRITSPVGVKNKDLYAALKAAYQKLDETDVKVEAITTELVAAQEAAKKAVTTANDTNVDAVKVLLENIITAKEQYNDILKAIDEKKSELKEVHEIEVQANTLSALLVAKTETLKAKEEEAANIIFEAEAKAEELVNNAEEEAGNNMANAEAKAEAQRLELEEQAAITARDRAREEEQYKFDFSILKRNAEQELNDELAIKARSLDSREETIKKRELDADGKDKQIEDLSKELLNLQNSTEATIDKRVAEAEAKINKSHAIEKNWIKKDHDTQIAIVKAELANANSNIETYKATIAKLEELIEKANIKVADIAGKALEDANNKTTIAGLTSAIANANQGKK